MVTVRLDMKKTASFDVIMVVIHAKDGKCIFMTL